MLREYPQGTPFARQPRMYQIEQLALPSLDDADWARLYAFACLAHEESGSRPRSSRAYRNGQLGRGAGEQPPTAVWVARAGRDLIGRVSLTFIAAVPELATIGLYVHPGARRGGLGQALVREALPYAEGEGIRELQAPAWTPAGWQFCEHRRGRQVGGGLWQTLRLEGTNWEMIDQCCGNPPPGMRLVAIEQLPPDLAEEFVALYASVWADQPLSERGPPAPTLARRRELERHYQQLGFRWLTLAAQEPSGALVALTEVIYDPSQPEVVRQVLTGVRSSHRGLGLAKWLKSSMLRSIRARFPRAQEIVTGNSESNAPMLAINRALGFGEPVRHRIYSFELDPAGVDSARKR